MKYLVERELRHFDFWSGAKDNAKEFTWHELDMIEEQLEQDFDNLTETQINDMMWFEPEFLASLIGLEWDKEEGCVRREEDDLNEEEENDKI
jgi:hypothetical protein